MASLFTFVSEMLSRGERIVVSSVLDGKGNISRSENAQMIVGEEGIFSSHGGGALDSMTIKEARDLLEKEDAPYRELEITGEVLDDSDVAIGSCGRVLLYCAQPTDVEVFRAVSKAEAEHRSGRFVVILDKRENTGDCRLYYITDQNDVIGGRSAAEDTQILESVISNQMPPQKSRDKTQCIVQSIRGSGMLHLFGAGAVSAEIAKLAHMVVMPTTVLDNKPEFLTEARFPYSQRVLLSSFEALEAIRIIRDDRIAIATRGSLNDGQVLKWALTTPAEYIGIVGSRHKRDYLLESFGGSGMLRKQLSRIFAPIGIPIGAQTPTEIAVSVIAELIQLQSDSNR